MSAGEIHVADVGLVITATIQDGGNIVDVSSATGAGTKMITFQRPDKTTFQVAASFVTDGTDGKIKYTTLSTDLNQAGAWTLQGVVAVTSGTFHSDYSFIQVFPNLI